MKPLLIASSIILLIACVAILVLLVYEIVKGHIKDKLDEGRQIEDALTHRKDE